MGQTAAEKLAFLRELDPDIPDIYADVGRCGWEPDGLDVVPDTVVLFPYVWGWPPRLQCVDLTAIGDYHDWLYFWAPMSRREADEAFLILLHRAAERYRGVNRWRLRRMSNVAFDAVRAFGKGHYDRMGLRDGSWGV